ncbi:MAG: hypothetical protein HYS86_03225 [Candidatus Chisholmbacteria bacterium]|nr:hypothetical protein [Candidatus Chisholmbacteria bacterium]
MPSPDLEAVILHGVSIITENVKDPLIREGLIATYTATPSQLEFEARALADFCIDHNLYPTDFVRSVVSDEEALKGITRAVNFAHALTSAKTIALQDMSFFMYQLADAAHDVLLKEKLRRNNRNVEFRSKV